MSVFKAKMNQIRFRLGFCPRPHWKSLQRSPRPISWIKGPYILLRGGEGKEGGRMPHLCTGIKGPAWHYLQVSVFMSFKACDVSTQLGTGSRRRHWWLGWWWHIVHIVTSRSLLSQLVNLRLKLAHPSPVVRLHLLFLPHLTRWHVDKKLSYRRGTAQCVVSVEILPVAAQQCTNYCTTIEPWTKYQLSLIDPCDKIVL